MNRDDLPGGRSNTTDWLKEIEKAGKEFARKAGVLDRIDKITSGDFSDIEFRFYATDDEDAKSVAKSLADVTNQSKDRGYDKLYLVEDDEDCDIITRIANYGRYLDESKSIKITPDSKNKEIDIEDKSEVGAIGHPIKVGLGDPVKKSTNENIELCRKYFKSLEKDTDGNYIVLNDGNFEKYIYAENDEDAINKFKNYTAKKITKESKEIVKNILSRQLKDNKVKPFKDAKECPRGFAFKSSNGSSGQVRYNGKDYVFAVVDGELRVMTDAEAGSNWSETIYKK